MGTGSGSPSLRVVPDARLRKRFACYSTWFPFVSGVGRKPGTVPSSLEDSLCLVQSPVSSASAFGLFGKHAGSQPEGGFEPEPFLGAAFVLDLPLEEGGFEAFLAEEDGGPGAGRDLEG